LLWSLVIDLLKPRKNFRHGITHASRLGSKESIQVHVSRTAGDPLDLCDLWGSCGVEQWTNEQDIGVDRKA
jgi:hypothetical protein